jgi:hypothetical protein
MNFIKLIFHVSILLLFVYSCESQKVSIGLNLEKGHTYTKTNVVYNEINGSYKKNKFYLLSNATSIIEYKVLDIQKDIYLIEGKFIRMKIETETESYSAIFDSNAKDTNDIGTLLFKLTVNKPFKFKVSKKGKILEFEGFDHIFKNFPDKNLNLTEYGKKEMIQLLEQEFGLYELLKNDFVVYPDYEVELKETWDKKYVSNSFLSNDIIAQFTLNNISPNSYKISSYSKVSSKKPLHFVARGNFQIQFDLNGEQSSEIEVDKKTGWIKRNEINQKLSGKGKIRFLNTMNKPINLELTANSKIENRN